MHPSQELIFRMDPPMRALSVAAYALHVLRARGVESPLTRAVLVVETPEGSRRIPQHAWYRQTLSPLHVGMEILFVRHPGPRPYADPPDEAWVALVDLARDGHEQDFHELAACYGLSRLDIESLWAGTRARLHLPIDPAAGEDEEEEEEEEHVTDEYSVDAACFYCGDPVAWYLWVGKDVDSITLACCVDCEEERRRDWYRCVATVAQRVRPTGELAPERRHRGSRTRKEGA